MKTKSRFSRNVYAISNRIWCNKHLRHNHGKICGIRLIAIFNRTKWLKIRFWKLKFRDLSMFFLIPSLHSRIILVYGGVLAAIICVPTACARRPRSALGDLSALLLRCRCEPTAFTRRSFRSPWEVEPRRAICAYTKCAPWHGVRGNPTASSGDATAMPRRSLGALGDLTACTSAFWVFLARRAVAVRTPPWYDRGLTAVIVVSASPVNGSVMRKAFPCHYSDHQSEPLPAYVTDNEIGCNSLPDDFFSEKNNFVSQLPWNEARWWHPGPHWFSIASDTSIRVRIHTPMGTTPRCQLKIEKSRLVWRMKSTVNRDECEPMGEWTNKNMF